MGQGPGRAFRGLSMRALRWSMLDRKDLRSSHQPKWNVRRPRWLLILLVLCICLCRHRCSLLRPCRAPPEGVHPLPLRSFRDGMPDPKLSALEDLFPGMEWEAEVGATSVVV
ncbi:hypothetical protein U9M48_005535 [Paspalum notatum var. saurae]|uniref:Uncharacterized protein n=1 Tax=Paspalum notatum var. saurae TaxID=547442 RepID=A0AAQ3PXT4_PASNO